MRFLLRSANSDLPNPPPIAGLAGLEGAGAGVGLCFAAGAGAGAAEPPPPVVALALPSKILLCALNSLVGKFSRLANEATTQAFDVWKAAATGGSGSNSSGRAR